MTVTEQETSNMVEVQQGMKNAAARAYLASTDWYIIRLQETGLAVPPTVTEAMSISYGGDNITFPDASTQNTSPKTGFVNRIINGGMTIDQRNAGASVTPASWW
jgi:hypothetical protein